MLSLGGLIKVYVWLFECDGGMFVCGDVMMFV